MAGKVAKVQVAKYPIPHDFGDAHFVDPNSSGVWNMEEDEVLGQLSIDSHNKRVEALEQLRSTIRRANGGQLPYRDPLLIFQGLRMALADTNWDVRHKCIQLINDIIPQVGDDLDSCMSVILAMLIPNIGDSKISLRRSVIQTLHVYMRHTTKVQALFRAIVQYGLENEDQKVRSETVVFLPMLFTPNFAKENFFHIIQSLVKKLLDTSVDDNQRDQSLTTLHKIRNLVGEREFNNYLLQLSVPLRRYYCQLTGTELSSATDVSVATSNHVPFSSSRGDANGTSAPNTGRAHYVDSYEFGFIPSHMMTQINDQENFKTRAQAVEELKSKLQEMSLADITYKVLPHMMPFISFLNNLLDDSNFKITTVTLEILCILVEKLGQNVRHYLKPLSNALTKRMGDNKIVVRQAVMKVAMKMMQSYSARPVLSVICENLQHRNSRVRQETINIIIAALLKFPSCDFDLPKICHVMAPTLTDQKRQVRQAALECLSVIAQTMGAGKLAPLVQAVGAVELRTEGEGVMTAVQARLARRQLPKMGSDGLVEYAIPVPSSASSRSIAHLPGQGADMDWVLSVGGQTTRLGRSDTMELESVTSARSTPSVGMPEGGGSNPARPFRSAGRGRNKLPWEEERDARQRTTGFGSNRNYRPDDGPPKPRQTWMDNVESFGQEEGRRVPKHRVTMSGINADDVQDGGYKQLHINRLIRQQAGSKQFSGLDLAEQDKRAETSTYGEEYGREDESPVPIKATLARSATRRYAKKVPPITATSDKFSMSKDDDCDSAYATSLESTLESESHYEMMNSLKSIRSSASKKKEEIVKQSSHHSLLSRSPSPNGSHESGIWSNYSARENGQDISTSKKKSKKSDSPFEARPKLARVSSFTKKKSPESNGYGGEDAGNSLHSEYNPVSGVTFRENRTSDVQVVGRGYNEDLNGSDIKPYPNKSRERRRSTKGPMLSPLGMASLHGYGAVDWEDRESPPQDSIPGVVGKGMFESGSGTDYAVAVGNSQSQERQDKKQSRPERKDMPRGVVGVSVNKQGSIEDSSLDDIDNLQERYSLGLSHSFKEKLAQAQQQKQEEVDQKREKKKQEHEELKRKERERQQEKLRRLNTNESIGIDSLSISGSGSGSGPSTPKTRSSPAISPRKKQRPLGESTPRHPLSASSRSPLDLENPEDWKAYRDPDIALRDAQRKISQEDWEAKCHGINILRRLNMYHADTVNAQLHPVVIALLNEVKNLRSQVSRLAIVCIGEMFNVLKKYMDADVDITARALLAKNGESNGFIRDDVERALAAMVESVTPQRALVALVHGGATHRNPVIRKTASKFLLLIVEKMGPGRILSGIKDITDKVLPTAATFALDGSQETRYNGKKILYMLMSHQDFDKMMSRHLSANSLRNIKEVLESLRTKGLGGTPIESSSARGWRSYQGSRAASLVRGGSASSENLHATPKRHSLHADEATQDDIKSMNSLMAANDWRDRNKGITRLLELCESRSEMVAANVIKIFDKFLPRLQDPNSKVNLYALQVMLQIIPILQDSLASVITMTIGNVAPNLSSKNREIYSTTVDIIDAFMKNMDGGLLIQPFANQAQSASGRSKPDLVSKVAELVKHVYIRKQKQVILHVLPLLWHLLGATNSSGAIQGGSSSIRTATSGLINALYAHMGQGLLDRATQDPNVTPRHLQLLHDLIEQ